jgi:hypothetical protein
MKNNIILQEVESRIKAGELIVYLNEEYGYRRWFWFPNLSLDELELWWNAHDPKEYYHNIEKYPGDLYLVEDGDEAISKYQKDYVLLGVQSLDKLHRRHFKLLSFWLDGYRNKNNIAAHAHWGDDSFLRINNR